MCRQRHEGMERLDEEGNMGGGKEIEDLVHKSS